MEAPPLTLSVLHLRPSTLLLPYDQDPPIPSPLPTSPIPPSHPLPSFSPTHSYPAPYPNTTLGSQLAIKLNLANTKPSGNVMGVRMMCEIQSPNSRYRLGEVVHGKNSDDDKEPDPLDNKVVGVDTLPELGEGESVELEVESEVKELGIHIIIVSVAWETLDGRRTFQRFFKYNVNPPLAIKTRIHSTQHPNTALDLDLRERVYLEILAQNVSTEGIVFDKVFLEPVTGLHSRRTKALPKTDGELAPSSTEEDKVEDVLVEESEESDRTLLPSETRQYLFILTPVDDTSTTTPAESSDSPSKKSSFPHAHPPGTILPLGRLDLTWRSGPSHDPGRLQTSTLNRRTPVIPIAPARTLGTGSPIPARRTGLSSPFTKGGNTADMDQPTWEFDLIVLDRKRTVDVENEFEIVLRLGVRTSQVIDEELDEPIPPKPPILGLQYLTRPASRPSALGASNPKLTFSPPSRTTTPVPMTRTGSGLSTSSRPFSPLSQGSLTSQGVSSRPMTPISSQLKQASSSHLVSPSTATLPLLPVSMPAGPSFPPLPIINQTSSLPPPPISKDRLSSGEVQHLGVSLDILENRELSIVEEKTEATYTDPIAPARRWEMTIRHTLRFVALEEGLAQLGGLRVIVFDDTGLMSGTTGREWDSLGDIWVSG